MALCAPLMSPLKRRPADRSLGTVEREGTVLINAQKGMHREVDWIADPAATSSQMYAWH
jgi:hypothetical protein